MYPTGELTGLARRKALLRQSIARRRNECVAAAARVAQPIEWYNRARDLWRRLAPLLGFFTSTFGVGAARAFFPRRKIFHLLTRGAPALFRLFAGFRRAPTATGAAAADA